jgi:acetolactate synthase-1/2/3 large subunit
MKMRVADYIAQYLERIGVKAVFLVSGGGMMHLVDAAGKLENCRYICNHHEQACSMAAEGYARQSGSLGVCYATSGPGATNILTGLVGAWQDSAPILFLTGQSKVSQTIRGSVIHDLRQFGTFEVDIVPIVESVTKYAVFLDDPKMIRYHLEKAVFLATHGRPGPVLIDVPLDVQGAIVESEDLPGFPLPPAAPPMDSQMASGVLQQIMSASRPVILAGHGIRCAGAVPLFRKIVSRLQVPVVTTQLGKDAIEYDSSIFTGHPGVKGDRAGNFAVQNADLILTLGCSLHVQTTGWELGEFAVAATKIQVEVDPAVLEREQVGVSQKLCHDLGSFLEALDESVDKGWSGGPDNDWRQRCAEWKTRYAVMREPHRIVDGPVNYYEFVDVLSDLLGGQEIVVTDAGLAYYVMGQAFRVKASQRYIVSGALGAMGYALPASIGAAVAEPKSTVICVTGDGSLQTNIHELAVLRHHGLNVKLLVVNNLGYASIRNTQNAFFAEHLVGTGPENGLFFPPLDQLASTYGIPFVRIPNRAALREKLQEALETPGPVICEIMAQSDQEVIPTVSSVRLEDGSMKSKPLHDMFPFLSREEVNSNLYS